MTKEQHEQLRDLITKVQRIVYYARDEGLLLPYSMAVAISDADDLQGACYQFIEELRPVDPTPDEHP